MNEDPGIVIPHAKTAGLRPRVSAFALDYLLISAYLVALIAVVVTVDQLFTDTVSKLFTFQFKSQALGFLCVTAPITLYFAIGDSSTNRGTWGKRKRRLQVTDLDHQRISFVRSLARTVLKFIPWEIAHGCIWYAHFHHYEDSAMVSIGVILLWSIAFANLLRVCLCATHQSFYDFLTQTLVTHRRR